MTEDSYQSVEGLNRASPEAESGTRPAVELSCELEFAIETVRKAGDAALELFRRGDARVERKPDGTFVTSADLAADALIGEALRSAFPCDAVLSEETPDDPTRLANPRCWIVDPIDGTRSFVEGSRKWAVLLALVRDHRPVLGVAYWPAENYLHAGAPGVGVWRERDGGREPWQPRPDPASVFRIAATLSGQALLESVGARAPEVEVTPASTGLAGAPLLFERGMHAFLANPEGGPSEWDIAALEPIIAAAGGRVSDMRGNERLYNRPDPTIVGGYAAAVSLPAHARLMRIIGRAR